MASITINNERQLFVIPSGGGFTCHGFRALFNELRALLSRLGINDPRAGEEKLGTLEQYEAHREAIRKVAAAGGIKDTWFNAETPQAVRNALEAARKSGDTIRVFQGDPSTGRDWCEENDVMGRVGRSGGLLKVPLLIADGEDGGGAILDHCVVKLVRCRDGKVLYQHPSYTPPNLTIEPITEPVPGTTKQYTHAVHREGQLEARFTSMGAAAAYVAFLLGHSFTQPRA